jgi:conjugative transfer signal peptidase TraF
MSMTRTRRPYKPLPALPAGAVLYVLFLGILAYVIAATSVVNETPSEPLGRYLLYPLSWTHRGSLVTGCLPTSAVPMIKAHHIDAFMDASACPSGYAPLLKRVVGLPGDVISVDDQGVRVDGRLLPDTKPLPNWAHITTEVVPPGRVFGLGETPDSIDSRYFGSFQPLSGAVWVFWL